MNATLTCPHCNTSFSAALSSGMHHVPCQRCGELVSVPSGVSLNGELPATLPTTTQEPPKPSGFGSLGVLGLFALLIVGAGIAYWLSDMFRKKPNPTDSKETLLAPSTRPPTALSSIKLLPGNVTVVASIQPAVMAQYAGKHQLTFDQLITKMGLPATIGDLIRNTGLQPEQIEQYTIGLNASGLLPRPNIVLVLRQEQADDSIFVKQLKEKPLTFMGLPMSNRKIDGKTYAFGSEAKVLESLSAMPDYSHLPSGLRESIGKLSPASFAWLATDSQGWSKNTLVVVGAASQNQKDLPKRLEGLQAASVGIFVETDLQMGVYLRSNNSATAETWKGTLNERLTEFKPILKTESNWTSATFPLGDPPENVVTRMKKALGM